MTTPGDIDETSGSQHTPRINWPDVAVITLVLTFIIVLTIGVHLAAQEAATIAVCTVAGVVLILVTPRAITDLARLLRELKSRLDRGSGA